MGYPTLAVSKMTHRHQNDDFKRTKEYTSH